MKIERVWAMPSTETFTIAPIRALVERHMNGGTWIDPFCRDSIFKARCAMTNDINPKFAGTHNMDALDFLKSLPAASVDGILFDPPFSPRQVKEAYQGFGPCDTTRRFYSSRKREAARVLKIGGLAIVCGWNSLGLGAKNGLELEEILLVNHGDQNDTIVTVGRKVAPQLDFAAERMTVLGIEEQLQMKPMNTVDVLVKARALVERPEHWFQGEDQCGDARCAGFAICDAARGTGLTTHAIGAFKDAIGLGDFNYVPRWNDAPERTHAEILAAFDKAIEAERSVLVERE